MGFMRVTVQLPVITNLTLLIPFQLIVLEVQEVHKSTTPESTLFTSSSVARVPEYDGKLTMRLLLALLACIPVYLSVLSVFSILISHQSTDSIPAILTTSKLPFLHRNSGEALIPPVSQQ